MDENTQKAIRQVYKLLDTNNLLLRELQDISSGVEDTLNTILDYTIVNLEGVADDQTRIEILNKKIQDNITTLHSLVSSISLDETYFANATDNVFKRARYIENSNTIPDFAPMSSTVSGQIAFENRSCFLDWTSAANIYLKVRVVNVPLAYDVTHTFLLSGSDNIQFEQIKTFDVSFVAPPIADTYNVTINVADSAWDFDYSYSTTLSTV